MLDIDVPVVPLNVDGPATAFNINDSVLILNDWQGDELDTSCIISGRATD